MRLVYLLLILVIVGCSPLLQPSIQSIEITDTVQGGGQSLFPSGFFNTGASVSANVVNPGASSLHIRDVTLSFRNERDNVFPQDYYTVGEMHSTDGRYVAKLPGLNYGPYDAKVTARFRSIDTTGNTPVLAPDTIITKTQPFFISESDECFTFNSDVEGWTFRGFFDGGTDNLIHLPACNAAEVIDVSGALFVAITPNCIPVDLDPPSGSWSFDFVSPEQLEERQWQRIREVMVQITANIPIQVQPIITYRDTEGQEHIIAETDSNGLWVFYPVHSTSFSYQDIFSPLVVPSGASDVQFRVRVFGVPLDTVSGFESFVKLNTVCPILPNRPRRHLGNLGK